MKIAKVLTLSMILALSFTSCDKDDDDPIDLPIDTSLTVQNVVDLEARGFIRDMFGDTIQELASVYYDFSSASIVDSTDAWDIAFKSTEIRLNGGSNGDQGVLAAIETGLFDEITEAPGDSEMATDTEFGNAIFNAPGLGWWNYSGPPTFVVSPIPGNILVFKTAEGNYAKMEILHFYEGSPESPNFMTDLDGFYTFDFVYQPDGTNQF